MDDTEHCLLCMRPTDSNAHKYKPEKTCASSEMSTTTSRSIPRRAHRLYGAIVDETSAHTNKALPSMQKPAF